MNKELEANTNLSHYRIVSKIGEGGMGEVYLAQDTKLDRKVAIKFLNEEFSRDSDKLNRFIQEAKAASALNHPNILTVYEVGEVDGKNYISTELIDGQTLRQQLSQKEALPLNTILKIGVQVAEALSAAHQAGIIHRDIKPANIMIRRDGYAKVLDFGLAKLSEPGAVATGSTGSEDATRVQVNTNPGVVMGTVAYMSPEQARGNPTDARTDVWSLGVVLYEMVARKVPFSGETVNHTIVSILEKEPLLLNNGVLSVSGNGSVNMSGVDQACFRRLNDGWRSRSTPIKCSLATCVYRCVVAIEAWPKNSCTTRMSTPLRRSNVATVCRSMCGVTCRSIPASRRNCAMVLAIP
jgi:serine/threonine protein kinase